MPEIVNQYTYTFVGGTTGTQWSFKTPMIPKMKESNYFDVDVCQLGIERDGASAPHSLFFFVANIPGTTSSVVTSYGAIDSRINLGMVANYDTGANPCYLTSPTPVSFRLNTLTPINPFDVTMCRLSGQEIAFTPNTITPPATLIPASAPDGKAQFYGNISDGGIAAGNVLYVSSISAGTIAVGQTVIYGTTTKTITALGTGTGGVGTYTVSGAPDLFALNYMASYVTDSVSPCQFIMTWNIKEIERD